MAQLPAKLIKLFRRNVERNSHSAGMVPGITGKEWPWNERNGIDDAHQFLLPQPPPPPSMMPIHHRLLTTVVSSPPSCRCHRHHWPPPTSVAHNHHNANDVATPCHPVNDDRPRIHDGIQGAMSLTVTWQTTNDDYVVVRRLYPK